MSSWIELIGAVIGFVIVMYFWDYITNGRRHAKVVNTLTAEKKELKVKLAQAESFREVILNEKKSKIDVLIDRYYVPIKYVPKKYNVDNDFAIYREKFLNVNDLHERNNLEKIQSKLKNNLTKNDRTVYNHLERAFFENIENHRILYNNYLNKK